MIETLSKSSVNGNLPALQQQGQAAMGRSGELICA
jgi:hypothetical protein